MKKIQRIGVSRQIKSPQEAYSAHIPQLLPPNPALNLNHKQERLLEKANIALGRLDGLTAVLPDINMLIYLYIRKEAVLSSQIEGTQSSLSDLLLFENQETPGVPLDDVKEISSYVLAINHGLARLKELPISARLLKEIHEKLMQNARGKEKSPGEFRRTQNWIGGTRPGNATFVPPPAEEIYGLMANLENFIHDKPQRTQTLIKAAISHVQFETIHPFLDGNGRVGRLLIALLLCAEGVLQEPVLYLSLYFKTHKALYYHLLQKVRLEGAWEEWVEFFLEGVLKTSEQVVVSTKKILELFEQDQKKIETEKVNASTLRMFTYLKKKVIVSTFSLKEGLEMSMPVFQKAIRGLEELGILKETTGRQRNRIWIYKEYFDLLNQGSEI